MSEWWDEFRQQMPVAERWAYFDHAAVAPLSLPAARALADWSNEVTLNGDANFDAARDQATPGISIRRELTARKHDVVAGLPRK